MDYTYWYSQLIKPSFAPPEWVFGLAWGIIYPLIAIAFVYLVYEISKKKAPKWLLWLFAANMVGNLLFTPIQFGLKNNILSSIDILFVLVTLLWLEIELFKKSKLTFVLLLPYLLWGAFATVLQLTITVLNY